MSAKIDIRIDSTNPGPTYISQSSYKIWPAPNTGLTGLYKKNLGHYIFFLSFKNTMEISLKLICCHSLFLYQNGKGKIGNK